MREFIHRFNSESDFENLYFSSAYTEPWLSSTRIEESGGGITNSIRVKYNKNEYEKLLETPLTFEITVDGDIVWKKLNNAPSITIEYSLNGEDWIEVTSTTDGALIHVVSGDTVQFRGNNTSYGTNYDNCNAFSGSTAQFNAKGNIMSLINSTNFRELAALTSRYTFARLFDGCNGLTDASKLLLPATTLVSNCYQNMFVVQVL